MRSYTPGGRFCSDFETNEILKGISADLTNPVGSSVMWYVWEPPPTSHVDPVYDVGTADGQGRQWRTPIQVPVIRAVIRQGATPFIERGFYNADYLHLTLDKDELMRHIPDIFDDPDPLNRDRVVWKGEVFRPYASQMHGIISERFTIISFDCQQIMPEEMVNDPQFQAYAQ